MKSRTDAVYPPGAILIVNMTGPPDGRPVLFSHPLMMTTQAFDPLVDRLAARGYRVISWDHYGQGSNAPVRGRRDDSHVPSGINLTRLTADAIEVIQGMGLRKPHFVGQGLGGRVGLRLAAWRPDLIASATAINASVDTERHREAINALADHIEQYGVKSDINLEWGSTPVVRLLAHASFGAWTRQNNPELVFAWEQRFGRLHRRIAHSLRAFAQAESIVDDLCECRVPVLAMAGAEDVLYPPNVSAEAVAHATGGRAVTIERAGHSAALEQPDVVLTHLEQQFAIVDQRHHR